MKKRTMKLMAAFLCAILVFMNSGIEQVVYASSIGEVSGNEIVTEPPLLDEEEKEDETPDTDIENEEEIDQEPVENTGKEEEGDLEADLNKQLPPDDIDAYAVDNLANGGRRGNSCSVDKYAGRDLSDVC